MAEPILWANRAQPKSIRMERGRRIVERAPQTASYGDHDSPSTAPKRWRRVVDSYGNDIRVPVTTAAADVDVDGPYGRWQRRKWRHFGWFEHEQCPVALVFNDGLDRLHIVSDTVVAAIEARNVCQPDQRIPGKACVHAEAEMVARRKLHAELEAERMKSFQSESDKLIAAHAKSTENIVSGVSNALAGALEKVMTGAPSREKERK
jgi:hypothetical protein